MECYKDKADKNYPGSQKYRSILTEKNDNCKQDLRQQVSCKFKGGMDEVLSVCDKILIQRRVRAIFSRRYSQDQGYKRAMANQRYASGNGL